MDNKLEPDILLSISGGAGLFPAAFGACYEIDRYIKEIHPNRRVKYGGVSSGCIIALSLALGLTEDTIHAYYREFSKYFDAFYKVPVTYWYTAVRKLIHTALGKPDSYKELNGKLFIGVTKISLNGVKFDVVENYRSNDHVADTIIASGTLFPLSWTPFRIYEGSLACDGGFMYNHVILRDHYNIVFKYEHISGTFTSADWMISASLDKWSRLYINAREHIQTNGECWRSAIRSGSPTKSLITGNKFVGLLQTYRWFFVLLQNKGVRFVIIAFFLWLVFRRHKKDLMRRMSELALDSIM
jgi:hypothetical protein